MKNKKLQIWLPLFVALVMIAGMYLGYRMSENIPAKRNFFAYEKRSPVQEVLNLIQNRYVDPVGTDTLGDNAIEEMLGHLGMSHVSLRTLTRTDERKLLNGLYIDVEQSRTMARAMSFTPKARDIVIYKALRSDRSGT